MLPLFAKFGTRTTPTSLVRGIVSSARDPLLSTPKLEGTKQIPNNVEKTVLEGGAQVLSVDTPSTTTTLSVFVKAGTRYETRQTIHSAAFLKYLAYKGTHEKSAIRLYRDLEFIGASLYADFTRDYIVYHIHGLRLPEKSVNLDIMAETLRYVLNPLLLEYEIERVRPIVSRDAERFSSDPKTKLLELLHAEAFRDSGLGQQHVPTSAAVNSITNQLIHVHVKNNYYPGDRMTIVGTGIEHVNLVEKLKPLFSNPTLKGKFHELRAFPFIEEEPPTLQTTNFIEGGAIRLADSGNTHVMLGFPGMTVNHKDAIAGSILSEIIGGGILNPAGPGDVRYSSRLHSEVVKKGKNWWVEEISASHIPYSDAGIFVVYASAAPGHGKELVTSIVDVLKSLSINEEDLALGQRVVKNKFLRGLSDKFSLAEHLATVGNSSSEYLKAVDNVGLGDLKRVAKTVLGARPVVAAVGDVRGVPKLG